MKNGPKQIFVFGSNLRGIHGAGAALHAVQNFGAIRGIPIGPQGDAYAIPTKESPKKSLSVNEIKEYVNDFIEYATLHPKLEFHVTAIGCGLAGFRATDIAPLFRRAPANCILPREFREILDRPEL